MEDRNTDEFYANLKEQLANSTLWPSKYLYKFIVPTSGNQQKEIETIFDNMGAIISKKESRKGNFVSLSITTIMKNPEAVIAKYKEIAAVEGVISL